MDRGNAKDYGKCLQKVRNQTREQWLSEYKEKVMADMSKYNAPLDSDNDLKADGQDEMGKTFRFTIKSVGDVTYPPGKYSEVEVTKSTLFFVETEQRLVVRPAMNRYLCKKYGNDSDGWVGKAISAESEPWKSDTGSGWMWTLNALDVEFDKLQTSGGGQLSEPDPDYSIPF